MEAQEILCRLDSRHGEELEDGLLLEDGEREEDRGRCFHIGIWRLKLRTDCQVIDGSRFLPRWNVPAELFKAWPNDLVKRLPRGCFGCSRFVTLGATFRCDRCEFRWYSCGCVRNWS
jgi:hypothetical protein